jgi:RNA polymerase sigma-70 factor (ECF subfamily)
MDGQAISMPVAVNRPPEDVAARVGVLFDLHHQRLFKLARRLSRCSEDARDLVQETFLRAARSPRSIPAGVPNEEAWLVRVLINICRDRWRQNAVRTRARLSGNLQAEAAFDPEPHLLAQSLVRHALAALAPRRRAILILYELEGATIPAIAKLVGVTPVTVRWHLSIGRREMARALGKVPNAHGKAPNAPEEASDD